MLVSTCTTAVLATVECPAETTDHYDKTKSLVGHMVHRQTPSVVIDVGTLGVHRVALMLMGQMIDALCCHLAYVVG
jgi:hypothetical protein